MVVTLEREKARLERELKRAQALVRSAQRTVGLPPLRRDAKVEAVDGKKKRRTRRAMVRASKVVEALQEPEAEVPSVAAPEAAESSVAS